MRKPLKDTESGHWEPWPNRAPENQAQDPCAPDNNAPAADEQAPSEDQPKSAPSEPAPAGDLEAALRELASAAAGGHSEPICAAYQQLRWLGRGMSVQDLLNLARGAAGENVVDLIVWAHARRRCFMCRDGTGECDACDGTGLADSSQPCPVCHGLGLLPCAFCRGTGWAERQTAPPELLAAIRAQQVVQVRQDAEKLVKSLRKYDLARLSLPPEKKRPVAAFAMRLRARIADLLQYRAIADEADRLRLEDALARIGKLLVALSR